jgi:CRISPR-associated endonuclease/helicase Cas3
MPIAHSKNVRGQPHDLIEHLQCVANMAGKFAAKFGARDLAYWAGIWHDVGKVHPNFQEYLHECEANPDKHRRGPDHKLAGSLVAAQKGQDILAFLIAGHHGGLPSLTELKEFLRHKTKKQPAEEAINLIGQHLEEIEPANRLVPPSDLASELDVEFFIRMLFSTLVDADFLDTERHFNKEQAQSRGRSPNLSDLWQAFEKDQAKFTKPVASRVNSVRQEVYQACLQAADQSQGIFRLTVPTGGGKTRSGMAFALKHALCHSLDRVIVAIPYTSIIEQTADVYRQIFRSGVLEHHSAVASHEERSDPVSLNEVWSRLAAENWDAPVVVTTTVQLFESLFDRKTTACRKLHNIARSVIILDEVQTLPTHILEPILDALKQLIAHYSVTVVLCTATQPALDNSPYLEGLDNVHEIVPGPARLFSALKRVSYEWPHSGEKWTWERVAEEMREAERALAVVNTKSDALLLLDALQDEEALHLSTLLCGAHRRAVLHEVRQRLKQEQPCLLVSTQVVEAGVDLDFPTVLRAFGPLDRIVQAAGRCNREGELAVGRVIVFDPEGGKLPNGAYRSATDICRTLLGRRDFDFNDPSSYRVFFQLLYQNVETDREKVQSSRKNLNYRAVAEKFQVIPDDSVPVIVRYRGRDGSDDTSERLISQVTNQEERLPRWLLQQLQPYLVNVRSRLIDDYHQNGLIGKLKPGLWEWLGGYDNARGLTVANRNPEELVL